MSRSILSIAILLILFALELAWGSVHIDIATIFDILTGSDHVDQASRIILTESRLPRAVTAILCGSALSLSGMLMQTLLRNPLAGPSILGISSGASLGVALLVLSTGAKLAGWSGYAFVALSAMLGAFIILVIVMIVSYRLNDNTTLLIFGIMLSFFTSAIVDALQFKATNESLRSYVNWGMGSFTETNLSEIALIGIVVVAGIAGTLMILSRMNLLLLGEDYAQSMGVNTSRTRMIIILVTGLLAGVSTAFCGPVAFIGLAVPHLVRMLLRTSDHRRILFFVLLFGAIVALFCDLLSRMLSLPLNTIASALGAPMVVYIILRGTKTKSLI